MSSRALRNWQTRSRKVLDEVEAAHAVVGGGRGARAFARQQINQAYVVLLSSQFQRFCRDLHSDAVDYLAAQPALAAVAPLLKACSLNRAGSTLGIPTRATSAATSIDSASTFGRWRTREMLARHVVGSDWRH